MDEARSKKSVRIPLPKTLPKVHEVITHILRLPNLISFEADGAEITVICHVAEGELVVPTTLFAIASGEDVLVPRLDDLLANIAVFPCEAGLGAHPLTTLIGMTSQITELDMPPAAWMVRRGDWLNSWSGRPRSNEPKGDTLFGIPIHYTTDEALEEGKLLLFGSPTRVLMDAEVCIVADIGGQS